jgi:anaerobic selenocysteine-containing dehydrogenase
VNDPIARFERVVASAPATLMRQNKPDGFACVSCAWAKPAKAHLFEFCEKRAKATTWEIATRRVENAFFAAHTLTGLEHWRDPDLEELGRLTHPIALGQRYRQVFAGRLADRI